MTEKTRVEIILPTEPEKRTQLLQKIAELRMNAPRRCLAQKKRPAFIKSAPACGLRQSCNLTGE
jgi:hypothetical protein